ncbi:hypothetical protein [Chromobacterium subtsugae]|uniref:hypothetical protein n=1 Tax=Chromobacterium subtsugae TaxID=251747 RepID=UPI000B0E3D5A|nr:hypothetical protein [Chromobacterium subtsugae]
MVSTEAGGIKPQARPVKIQCQRGLLLRSLSLKSFKNQHVVWFLLFFMLLREHGFSEKIFG